MTTKTRPPRIDWNGQAEPTDRPYVAQADRFGGHARVTSAERRAAYDDWGDRMRYAVEAAPWARRSVT